MTRYFSDIIQEYSDYALLDELFDTPTEVEEGDYPDW